MVIWSRIVAEKFRVIFKVCVCTDKGERGQPNVDRCGQEGEGGQKSLKMYGNPLWMASNKNTSNNYLMWMIYNICNFFRMSFQGSNNLIQK